MCSANDEADARAARTLGEGSTLDEAPVSCCPLANHVMTAGGFEMADLHLSVMVSPAVACSCPLIFTSSGATGIQQNNLWAPHLVQTGRSQWSISSLGYGLLHLCRD